MLSSEIIKKIKLIDIKTRLLVEEMFSGAYHSVFKGRGIEFSEVREYTYGDDVRTIDWNVTARFGRPFVKIYEEERELNVILLFDVSASTLFGSLEMRKRDMMVELAALLAFSAVENNDRVEALLFSDVIEKYVEPKKEKIHALRIVRELLSIDPVHRRTDLKTAFDFINSARSRRSIVFIFSDFFDTGYEKSFKMMVKRHDVVPVLFTDPLESSITDNRGLLLVRDIESGARTVVDLGHKKTRDAYAGNISSFRAGIRRFFVSLGIDYLEISTGGSYMESILEFFQKRAKRL